MVSPPSEVGGSHVTSALVAFAGSAARTSGGPGTTVAARRVMDTSYGQLLSPEGLPVEKIALKPFVPTPSVPQPPIAVPV